MDINSCLLQLQTYLADTPLVVLGSGVSASFGLPTMQALADEISQHKEEFSGDDVIKDFFENINRGIDLETALGLDAQMLQEDKDLIKQIVWKFINTADKAFFRDSLDKQFVDFSLVSLFRKLLEPTPHVVDIITTNYDRLAEYASDIIKANTVTGFEGHYYKTMEIPSGPVSINRIRARERTVNIWKVHGSLDWFLSPTGELCALSMQENIPTSFMPKIVPPGHDKYQVTHFDPYRFMMTQADKAIEKAKSFLVMGYGFNDDHIQPKIIEEIKKNKPIVVVTKKASPMCRSLIQQTSNKKYMIIEEQDGKTHVQTESSNELYDEQFWSLQGFMNKW